MPTPGVCFIGAAALVVAGGIISICEKLVAADEADYQRARESELQQAAERADRYLEANEAKGQPEADPDEVTLSEDAVEHWLKVSAEADGFARGPDHNEPTLAAPPERWQPNPQSADGW